MICSRYRLVGENIAGSNFYYGAMKDLSVGRQHIVFHGGGPGGARRSFGQPAGMFGLEKWEKLGFGRLVKIESTEEEGLACSVNFDNRITSCEELGLGQLSERMRGGSSSCRHLEQLACTGQLSPGLVN